MDVGLSAAASIGLDEAVEEAVKRGVTLTPWPPFAFVLLQDLYGEHRDPFAAWEQYRAARRYGRKLPTWCMEYLDRVGDALMEMGRRYAQNGGADGKRFAADVAAALEMKLSGPGAGTVLKRSRDRWRNFEMAWEVRWLINEGEKYESAVNEVATKHGLKSSRMRAIYSEAKPGIERAHRAWTQALERIRRRSTLRGRSTL